MKEKNIKVVEDYFNALKHRDLSLAAFADEIYFEDPIAEKHRGAENLRAFLSGFISAINGIEVYGHICEGEYVVSHFAVDTVFGIIPTLEKFRIVGGEIIEIYAFYDPRPVLGC